MSNERDELIEQAARIVADNPPEQQLLDPAHFARIAVGLGWDFEETAREMADHFDLPEQACREVLLAEQREQDEIDLRNVADDLDPDR
jgi:hypothetical protein